MSVTTQRFRQQREGRRFDPSPGQVRYSERWIGAAASGSALVALALVAGGAPAAAALGLIGASGAAYALWHEPRQPRLEQVTLRLPQLPSALDGLRIAQLSDLHLGLPYTTENTRWAVERLVAEQPDLLVMTGDFVSYEHAIPELPELLAPLRSWRPRLGIFAVPGNHDYWEGFPAIEQTLAPLGIEFLLNSHRRLRDGEAELVLAGVDDMWDGAHDLAAALDGAPEGVFTVLLSHCPDLADEAAARGVHLQLSGHTHGGHVYLPLLGSLCLPRHGWRYPIGRRAIGALQLYVSRGIGGLPLRLGCPPEATILTLRHASATGVPA